MAHLQEIIAINKINKRHFIEGVDGLIQLCHANDLIMNDLSSIDGAYILPKEHKIISSFITQREYDFAFIHYKGIIKILDNVNDVVLCGGAALWGILQESDAPNDFDLFIYGDNSEATQNEKINKIINILYDEYLWLEVYQVKGVITINYIFNGKYVKVQIILRDYTSISEILHSFDLSCCAIAWDGNITYMTHFALWSISNKIIYINPQDRSKTYEFRLIKYFNKGFALLFPNLKLPECFISDPIQFILSKKMTFTLLYVNGNMAIAEIMPPLFESLDIICDVNENIIDYDAVAIQSYYSVQLQDTSTQNERNFYSIITGLQFFEKYILITPGSNTRNKINSICVAMPLFQIIDDIGSTSYTDELCDRWILSKLKDLIINLPDQIELNENLLKTLLKDNYEQFAIDNNIETIKQELETFTNALKNSQNIYLRSNILILSQLKKKLINYLKNAYSLRKNEVYNFVIHLDRSAHLTSGLNICAQSDLEWYGGHFIEAPMSMQFNSIKEFIDNHMKTINEEDLLMCAICFGDIHQLESTIIKLKCGHFYCKGCIYEWLRQNPTCPRCRLINPEQICAKWI